MHSRTPRLCGSLPVSALGGRRASPRRGIAPTRSWAPGLRREAVGLDLGTVGAGRLLQQLVVEDVAVEQLLVLLVDAVALGQLADAVDDRAGLQEGAQRAVVEAALHPRTAGARAGRPGVVHERLEECQQALVVLDLPAHPRPALAPVPGRPAGQHV